MEHDAGIDVSLKLSSVGIADAKGKIVKEAKAPSDPDALVAFFRPLEDDLFEARVITARLLVLRPSRPAVGVARPTGLKCVETGGLA